ncbi:MAG TPA: phosphohistidine phosphatase SixA [Anaerolineae bacterium]|nr:phosphohistidine phosphatase SixA [Anaerolineae bacterium]
MKLYFLRHGMADWPDWDPARDHERPLTKDGVKKMKEQAKALADLDVKIDAVLSSPYTRAYQTADIVAGKLGLEVKTEPQLAPGFNLDKLKEIVPSFGDDQSLLLVGHEPNFSMVIAEIIGGGRVQLKKGTLARVDVNRELQGELVWLLQPKVLTRRG